ncbi:glycosyltransferase family 4 protein [Exiguobacterium acetylicum]|uniref:glycosyltransferase family 4 protein n=1 Tax=Exiguobacterium acetylicum TaxID=41170 RepID=UPI0034D65C97
MKILVVGPVTTKSYFGGVAVFTENLAIGLHNKGYEVKILTDYTDKNYLEENLEIKSVSKRPLRRNVLLTKYLMNEIEKENPDYIITSLEYGMVNRLIKKSELTTKTIHFLHGFMSKNNLKKNNGLIKGNIIKYSTKFICENTDFVISNSTLTASLNYETSNIITNKVINLAPSYDFIKILREAGKKEYFNEKRIVYIGRLSKSKNVDLLIEAMKLLDPKIHLDIIGDGPDRLKLEKQSKDYENIVFHGRLSLNKIVEYYLKANIFISLNPQESYGISFNEALLADCDIVAPLQGGQNDILLNFKDRVSHVDPFSIHSIARGIKDRLNKSIRFTEIDKNVHSFDRVADEMITFINNSENKVT